MQNGIKKRAGLYGVAAILSAVLLGSICYYSGLIPRFMSAPSAVLFKTFSSSDELRAFLTTNANISEPFLFVSPSDTNMGPVRAMTESGNFATAPGLAPTSDSSTDIQHSSTNIQVSGVDEADIVKTDGEYLYIISGSIAYILKAFPDEEARILSRITLNDTNLVGLFVSQDSDRLAILGSKYNFPEPYYRSFVLDVKTFLKVYDISNKSKPTLLTDFNMTGSYFNSRMIGDRVYFVVSQPAYVIYDTVILPKVYSRGGMEEIGATDILYSNASDDYFLYTTVIAINVEDTAEEPSHKTLLLGGTSSMYVSLSNIYITFPEPNEKTTIYRIRIENSTISPEARGTVPGHELNQFSMDENSNYLRIATTSTIDWMITSNNLYILNMSLSIVGSLENIAPGEVMDSSRFIGNRCYLATSVVRIDPFFVIDVENATAPKILGWLKIPGFTRYLHPYDENHIIGVGVDENNRAKISLFDVSNVSAPVEIDIYSVPGDWSETTALTEHKAFLFDKSKNLLALPVSIQNWRDTYWQWQGLYVFNITSSGFALRGNVTHQDLSEAYWYVTYHVKRALYIEDVLYTISDKRVQLNSLEDLTVIKKIELD